MSLPHLQIPMPPWREAARLLEEYKIAARRRNEAGAEIAALDRQVHQVKQQDLEASAKALLEGKPQPPRRIEKHEALIAAKRASLEPLELNRTRAAEKFVSHIAANRKKYRQAVADSLAELGDAPISLDTLEEIERLIQWREWLDRFPTKAHVLLPVRLKVGVRGQEVAVREVLMAASGVVASVTQEREEASA